jgi:hypothetical protein
MPDMNQWSRNVENLVDEINRSGGVQHGTLRSRVLELMQGAYHTGLADGVDLWERRQMVARLLPVCNTQGGIPGHEEIERAKHLTEQILASVK